MDRLHNRISWLQEEGGITVLLPLEILSVGDCCEMYNIQTMVWIHAQQNLETWSYSSFLLHFWDTAFVL